MLFVYIFLLFAYSFMYTGVHYKLNILFSKRFIVQCFLCYIYCILKTDYILMYVVFCSMHNHNLYCMLYTVYRSLYALFIFHFILGNEYLLISLESSILQPKNIKFKSLKKNHKVCQNGRSLSQRGQF